MTESMKYEDLRDQTQGEIGAAWREADRYQEYLTNSYRDLAADESLSEQGRYQKATTYYENVSAKIEDGRARARKLATEEARKAERASVPLPDGFTLASAKVADSSALIAVQNETQMILSRIEKQRARMPEGLDLSQSSADSLREAYSEGLETGGLEGHARCRAALEAAKSLGVEVGSVVDPHRTQAHRDALDRAGRLSQVAQAIGGSAPEPPFSTQEAQGGSFHSGGAPFLFAPKKHTRQPQNPRKTNPWSR
jgi:hypothetical protein